MVPFCSYGYKLRTNKVPLRSFRSKAVKMLFVYKCLVGVGSVESSIILKGLILLEKSLQRIFQNRTTVFNKTPG